MEIVRVNKGYMGTDTGSSSCIKECGIQHRSAHREKTWVKRGRERKRESERGRES